MNKRGNIGLYEAVSFATMIMIYKVFFTGLSSMCRLVGTAAWYSSSISCAVSIFFFYLVYILMKRFPGNNLFDIIEIVFGKYIGKAVNTLFVIYSIFYSAASLREFVEMIKVYNLPYTPISVILGSFLLLTSLMAYYGLEVIARLCGWFVIPILAGLALILIFALPNYDISYLKPFGGYGLNRTLITGLLGSSNYIEVSTIWLFINSIHGIKYAKKAGIISLLIAGAVQSVTLLCYLMTFTYTTGSDNLSGLFELSKSIYFNRFFQRMESIFFFVWIISSLILVSMAFYVALTIYAQTYKINNHRPLIFPFVFLGFMIAILPKNFSELLYYFLEPLRTYSAFLLYLFPVFILLFSIITRKKGKTSDAQKA